MTRSKHSRTCPARCGLHSAGTALLPGLECSSGSHRDSYSGWFSQRKTHEPTSTCACYWAVYFTFLTEQEEKPPSRLLFSLTSEHTNHSSSISLPPICSLLSLPSLHHLLTTHFLPHRALMLFRGFPASRMIPVMVAAGS